MTLDVFNFGANDGGREQKTRMPYVSIVTPTSANVGEFVHGSDVTAGEFSISGQPEYRGFGLNFLPLALPQAGREYSVTPPQGEEGFAKNVCRSNDGVVPVGNGHTFEEPRVGKTVRIDKSLQPHQLRQDADALSVGGCAACPLSKWGNTLKLPENSPAPCQQTSLSIFYVLTGYVPNPTAQTQGRPIEYFRTNGYNEASFNEVPWDKFVVFVARSYSNQSLNRGRFTTPIEKTEINTISMGDALKPYAAPATHANSELLAFLRTYNGTPEHLMAFRYADGTVARLKDVERGTEIPEFFGMYMLQLYTIAFRNKRNTMSFAAAIRLPDTNSSPILVVGSEEYNHYVDMRARIRTESLVEIAGFVSSTTPLEIVEPTALSATVPSSDDDYNLYIDAI